jgi:NTE family protein
MRAAAVMLWGAPSFFQPRVPPPLLPANGPGTLSYYDTSPLKGLLERLIDFDRINHRETRFSVGAVNIKTGNFIYFDNTTHKIGAAHVMASGALPPGLPAAEVDGEYYWDGGLVSNTPLQWVLDAKPRLDTLAFQVDLWSARGELPRDMVEVDTRQKDIRYSSRTRAGTDSFRRTQALRRAAGKLLEQMPEALRQTPEAELLAQEADQKVYNIVHTIYRAKRYESTSKDYEFSRLTMEEHWKAGYSDMDRTLRHPEVLERPKSPDGVFTFDLAVQGRE